MIIDPITSDIIKYYDTATSMLCNSILYISYYAYYDTYLWADKFSVTFFSRLM